MNEEFDPPIAPGDTRYIPPGRNLTAGDGTAEGDCPAVNDTLGYACTLDSGHAGPHIAHGTEDVNGQDVDLMYAQWDEDEEEAHTAEL